jgi:N-methylhydantoinase A
MRYLIAADTGGTFTDVVVHDRQTNRTEFGKTLTNYDDLVTGVLDGMADTSARLDDAAILKHGTTHVINAFIQRNGGKTALITTAGFRDLLEIGRGNRAVPFRLDYRRFAPLVPRELRFGVEERIGPDGEVIQPLDVEALRQIAATLRTEAVEAVAISFLNGYRNPVNEDLARSVLTEELPGVFITTGAELSREWSEYERTSTAAANAYVGAQMSDYVRVFDDKLRANDFSGAFYMMGSNGGVMSVPHTLAEPIALIESGPIGGCIGAAAYAEALDQKRMIAFDMGGTTAKCALVEDGRFEVQPTYYVGGYEQGFPIRTPVLDIVEVGAGGGSIAWVDDHGRLQLGPRSAGSVPGPVAFGRGGAEPTVTDANVALGRIGSDSFMNGKLLLDVAAARAAIGRLATRLGFAGESGVDRVAQGILDLAAVTMTSAIKEITIERGRDARDFVLFVFGGGGPLFGAELAHALAIREVIVPPQPGNFSSLGMLLSEARMDVARTHIAPLTDAALGEISAMFGELEDAAGVDMADTFGTAGIRFEHAAEMRYRGQKHTVRVRLDDRLTVGAVAAAFEKTYRGRYGHLNEGAVIEFIALRVGALVPTPRPDLAEVSGTMRGPAPAPRAHRLVYFAASQQRHNTAVYRRSELPVGFSCEGPVVIEEYSSTTVVGPADSVTVGTLGELRIICKADRECAV